MAFFNWEGFGNDIKKENILKLEFYTYSKNFEYSSK